MADKIRVLQVIGAMNRAGAETVVMNLMRAIDRERFQFDFLVHEAGRCDYDDEIEELGGTIYRIPRYNVANGHLYRRIVRKFFAEHPEIQVVHGHIGSCCAIYLDEAKRAGCATIAHSHNEKSRKFIHRNLYHLLVRKVPGIADEFMACGYQAGVDRFGTGVVGGAHFNVMWNGIDTSVYACSEEEHEQAKDALGYAGVPFVGNIGRMVEQKNQVFLLRMFAELLKQVPQARLAVVGRGPLEEDLRALADELGISGSVDFLGVRDDVPCILKAIDLFAFPSIREGLPVSMLEAQAAGAPVLTSDAVSRSAFVSDTAQALPLSAGPKAWADEMARILATPVDRSKGAADVRAHGFDIHDVAAGMEDFYEKLALQAPRTRDRVS